MPLAFFSQGSAFAAGRMPPASTAIEAMKRGSDADDHSSSPADSSAHHAGEASVKSGEPMKFAAPEATRPVPAISRGATGETKQMKHGDFEDRSGRKKFENPRLSLATCRQVGMRDSGQGDEARRVSRLQHWNMPGIESGRQSTLGILEAERYRLIESTRLTFGRGSGRTDGVIMRQRVRVSNPGIPHVNGTKRGTPHTSPPRSRSTFRIKQKSSNFIRRMMNKERAKLNPRTSIRNNDTSIPMRNGDLQPTGQH